MKLHVKYVHVDIMSAKSYFSEVDLYDEIDPSLIACLITSVLSTLLLSQLSLCENVQKQYQADVAYLCGHNLNERLSSCLQIANCDPNHQNAIFEVLLKRIREQFPEYDEIISS